MIELSVACPGASFLGLFFNLGLDVDGDGILEFSKITEPVDAEDICGELLSLLDPPEPCTSSEPYDIGPVGGDDNYACEE